MSSKSVTASCCRPLETVDRPISSEILGQQSLGLWFGAWMALGAMLTYGFVSFLFGRTFYFICLGFWASCSPRMAVCVGAATAEVVQLSREGLELRMDHGTNQGRPTLLPLSTLGEAVVPEPNPRSFLESMENQFWVVGGDRIHLAAKGKTYVFGKQLSPKDAQQLAKAFNQRLKKLSR